MSLEPAYPRVSAAIVVVLWLAIVAGAGWLSLREAEVAHVALVKACDANAQSCVDLAAASARMRSAICARLVVQVLGGALVILGAFGLPATLEKRDLDRRSPRDYTVLITMLLGGALVSLGLFLPAS